MSAHDSARRDRDGHTRAVFRQKLEEFLALSPHISGSLTFHFQNGEIKRTEWRTLDSTDEASTVAPSHRV